jgi:general secretion pathway protein L
MQEKIIIYLASHQEAPPSWVTVTENGEIEQVVLDGQPDELAQFVFDKQVIIVVPAQSVLLTSASLPKMPRSRLIEALPFALEEHLVTEVEALHFATGERQLDETVPVAVISKNQMEAWLNLLRSWHVTPQIMLSQVFALPVA